METKHTGGEWRTFHQDDDIFIETEGRITAIASIRGGAGEEEDEANAKVLVIAPRMLAALTLFVTRVEQGEVRSTKTYNSFKELIKLATE